MQRSSSSQAIILSLKPLGENNSSVTLISPENGISYATLYGGPKSKMRSLVAQWNSGQIWLYENPEKKQTKISDFEVKNYHSSFSESLFKAFAANLAAELVIKTRCAGSNEQCFTLLSGFLDGMDLCDEEQSRVGLIRFLWRYLELLGVQPDAVYCAHCGQDFLSRLFAPKEISYYNSIENNFICKLPEKEALSYCIPISSNAVKYLAAISTLTPAEVRKIKIDKEEYEQIKQIVFFLIENNIEQKLNSIQTGIGIL